MNRRFLLMSLLPLFLVAQGCSWIPRSYVNRADHSEETEYDVVEGSPMYKLIPRGWIQPVNNPKFVAAPDVDFMSDEEPVIVLEHNGESRIYSTWFLDGHEVVNDEVGGDALAVTWCPLVQAGVVYGREAPDGEELTFQASGRLWRDALVMYDKETKSLWTQHDGRALVGASHDAGVQLPQVPSARSTWAEAKVRYPDALVLKKKANLLGGGTATIYDDYLERTDQLGIFGTHLADSSLPGKTEVLTFVRPESAYAVALPELVEQRGVNMSVGGDPVFVHALASGRLWRDALVMYDKETKSL
ncbi:MAG: DUF3179 domain-containing protein, partial [Proteobacteria bacterium]|nr:DUF3179 domain-containing protein [Pseudomonadota bacterium]